MRTPTSWCSTSSPAWPCIRDRAYRTALWSTPCCITAPEACQGIGGVARPGIVHRLDKDTSGVMVAAKTDAAHAGLSALFARHDIERRYIRPHPRRAGRRSHGVIHTRIGRSPHDRKKMAVLKSGGREAITRYRVSSGGSARPPSRWPGRASPCGNRKPAAPTRSACTWLPRARPAWATPSTAPDRPPRPSSRAIEEAGPASPGLARRRARLPSILSPARRCVSRRPCPPTWPCWKACFQDL